MLFYEYLKTYLRSKIKLFLKNDMEISGEIVSVDPYLNVTIENARVENNPAIKSLYKCSIRGSSIKYIEIPSSDQKEKLAMECTRLNSILTDNL